MKICQELINVSVTQVIAATIAECWIPVERYHFSDNFSHLIILVYSFLHVLRLSRIIVKMEVRVNVETTAVTGVSARKITLDKIVQRYVPIF